MFYSLAKRMFDEGHIAKELVQPPLVLSPSQTTYRLDQLPSVHVH